MGELKPRIMNLLINALQFESDSHNTQMLLGTMNHLLIGNYFNLYFIFSGGLLLCVQDSAISEESQNYSDSDVTAHSDTTSNLLSSGILKLIIIFYYIYYQFIALIFSICDYFILLRLIIM